MSLPSAVTFYALQYDYIAQLNQFVTDLNALNTLVVSSTSSGYFIATSTSSVAVGSGSKTFTLVESGARAWSIGATLHVADSATPANFMEGVITAYAHPSVTISASTTGGSGTHAAWSFGLASPSSVITSAGVGALTANQFVVVNAGASAITGVTLPRSATEDPCAWMFA